MVIWMFSVFNFAAFFIIQALIGVLQIIVNLFTLLQAKKATPLVRKMIYGYWVAVLVYFLLLAVTQSFNGGLAENWIVLILIPCLLAVFSLAIPVVATRK